MSRRRALLVLVAPRLATWSGWRLCVKPGMLATRTSQIQTVRGCGFNPSTSLPDQSLSSRARQSDGQFAAYRLGPLTCNEKPTKMPAPTDDATKQPTSLKEVLRVARAWLRGGWRAAHDIDPEFWRNLQRELLAGRQWVDRVHRAGLRGRDRRDRGCASRCWPRRRSMASGRWKRWGAHGRYFDPALDAGAHGSAAVVDAPLRAGRRWARASRKWCARWTTTCRRRSAPGWSRCACRCTRSAWSPGGLLAGLSIGREGPTVQVGAGVMVSARRWLSPQSGIDAHDLMVAGAAAGIAAAFNTPLGGIVFALEQLTRRRHISHSSLVIAAIVLAGLVAVAVFGNETYFGRLRVQAMSWSLLAARSAGGAGGRPERWAVCATDRGFGARPARPLQPLAQRPSAALCRRLRPRRRRDRPGHPGRHGRRGLRHDARPAGGPGRTARRLHAAEVLRHLDLGLVRRAGRRLRAVAGHRRRHRPRRGALHGHGQGGRHPADRDGHGGLSGGHDAAGRSRPSSSSWRWCRARPWC